MSTTSQFFKLFSLISWSSSHSYSLPCHSVLFAIYSSIPISQPTDFLDINLFGAPSVDTGAIINHFLFHLIH